MDRTFVYVYVYARTLGIWYFLEAVLEMLPCWICAPYRILRAACECEVLKKEAGRRWLLCVHWELVLVVGNRAFGIEFGILLWSIYGSGKKGGSVVCLGSG